MTAIEELLAKVEADEYEPDMFCPMWHRDGLCVHAEGAFGGSFDAALALFNAVLPGWGYTIEGDYTPALEGHSAFIHSYDEKDFEAVGCDTPARALLIAILKAMKERT